MSRRAGLAALATLLSACQPVAVCQSSADCAPDGRCVDGVCLAALDGGVDDAGAGQDAGESDGGLSDAGPVDAGAPDGGAPDAGEPDAGAPDAGLPFDAGRCLSCPEGFACDEGLVACTPQVLALRFATPDANDVFGGGQPVRLEVRVELDASVPLPGTVLVTSTPPDFTPPPLALQPGVAAWAADAVTPDDGGSFHLTARVVFGDAGFEASTWLLVDARRPVVALVASSPPARVNDGGFGDRDPVAAFASAWKKDEVVELRVESTAPVRVSAADFGLPPQSLSPRTCSACAPSRSCACFAFDLAFARLDGLRGVLDAGVGPLPDALGNLSLPTSVALPVTRWKWRRLLLEPAVTGLGTVHPPALDVDGRVHVGVGYTASTQGALWQVLPTGETRVDVVIEETQGPPIATGRVLFAQGDNSQVRRYDTTQSAVAAGLLQSAGATFCNNERWEGLSAAVDERLFLLGTTGRAYSGWFGPPAACESWTLQPAETFAPRGVVVASPLAGTAARVLLGRAEMRPTLAGLTRVDFFPAASPRFQASTQAVNPQGTTSLVAFDEVIASSSRVAMPRTTVAVSAWSSDLTVRYDARIAGDAGTSYGPLVVAGPRARPTFLLGDGAGALRRFPYTPPTTSAPDGGAFGSELPPITGVDALEGGSAGAAAPVLGRNGLAYLVSPVTGRLSVVNVASGQVEWTQANAFTPGAVSPALDVVRDRSLVKQCSRGIGLLYVVARNDAALTAIVVDSAGLDGTSPWPRFHHDNGNTGNAETPLGPWSCP